MAKARKNNIRAQRKPSAPGQAFLTRRERVATAILKAFRIKVESPQFAADLMTRGLITVFALVGAGVTAYLTYVGFTNAEIACTSSAADGGNACSSIQQISWASVGAVPLALFGLVAYVIVAVLAVAPLFLSRFQPQRDWMQWSALALVFVAASMMVFSFYLMHGLWFRLNVEGTCVFCITSAVMSTLLAISSLFVYNWRKVGQLFGVSAAALVLTLVVALPTFTVPVTIDGRIVVGGAGFGAPTPGVGWDIRTESGESEIALAKHLAGMSESVTMFGAWWCEHCHTQKELFGAAAWEIFKSRYVECSLNNRQGITPDCAPFSEIVRGFPTWLAGGSSIGGAMNLEDLANRTGYTGPTDFRFTQG